MSRPWAVAALLTAAVAAGGVANEIDSRYLASGWHAVERGEAGSDVTVGSFRVHVHSATASPDLGEDPDLGDDEVVTSPGAFVVVDLSYATADAWDAPEEVVLIDGAGREFSEPSGFGSDGRVWPAGPDIWSRGTLLFEVSADAVDDLTLEFRPQGPDARLPSTVLQVPLTVDVSTGPVTLERSRILPQGER